MKSLTSVTLQLKLFGRSKPVSNTLLTPGCKKRRKTKNNIVKSKYSVFDACVYTTSVCVGVYLMRCM